MGKISLVSPFGLVFVRRFANAMLDGPVEQMNSQAVDCVVSLSDERVELAVRVVTAAVEALPAQGEEPENRDDTLT
jgi:hypothetical protein